MTYLEVQIEANTMKDNGRETWEERKEDNLVLILMALSSQHNLLLASQGLMTNLTAESWGEKLSNPASQGHI